MRIYLLCPKMGKSPIAKICLQKTPGSVVQPQSATNWAVHMLLWKAQEPRESKAALMTVVRGNRMTNSISWFCETITLLELEVRLCAWFPSINCTMNWRQVRAHVVFVFQTSGVLICAGILG